MPNRSLLPAAPRKAGQRPAWSRLVRPLPALASTTLATLGAVLILGTPVSFAQGGVDALRVRQLEQDILRLQRELDTQSRRLETLERTQRMASAGVPTPAPTPREEESSPSWLIGTNWDRLRPGMKELDVIALLGRPTTVRLDDDGKGRAFFYALELGPNAILTGNVRLGAAGVTEITRPALR
jgi:hypothetical protein